MSNQTNSRWLLALLSVQLIPLTASAATLKVPLQFPTIQAAINAAVTGDLVQVSPGTYMENINFGGKAISVSAVRGPRPTIIDGGNKAPVVLFNSGEGATSILNGFVIQHGFTQTTAGPCYFGGAGICVINASPTIEYNTIQTNGGCNGAGISIYGGTSWVTANLIQDNFQSGCSGGIGGGGISVMGAGPIRITNNVIRNNSMNGSAGGGISLNGAAATISGNIIEGNHSNGNVPCSWGGGISMINESNTVYVIQNQIDGNASGCGGGLFWLVPGPGKGPMLVNNTIANNTGAGIYADGNNAVTLLSNNVIEGSGSYNALYCKSIVTLIHFNDIYGASPYGGFCTDKTGKNGNISADPAFVSAAIQDYRLGQDSPAIDVGNNQSTKIPTTDFAGRTRILDGDQNGTAIVDMGIYEYSAAQGTASAANFPPGRGTTPSSRSPQDTRRAAGPFYEASADGRVTSYTYDASGRLVVQAGADGSVRRMK